MPYSRREKALRARRRWEVVHTVSSALICVAIGAVVAMVFLAFMGEQPARDALKNYYIGLIVLFFVFVIAGTVSAWRKERPIPEEDE